MLILSASVIWLISWATRWSTGAVDVTHGQSLLGAVTALAVTAFAVADVAAAAAGATARPAAMTAAASSFGWL
jgi:hypothetical protein